MTWDTLDATQPPGEDWDEELFFELEKKSKETRERIAERDEMLKKIKQAEWDESRAAASARLETNVKTEARS